MALTYGKHAAEAGLDAPKEPMFMIISRTAVSISISTIAEPQEVARAILFLATQRHITGTILSIDGGYTAQ